MRKRLAAKPPLDELGQPIVDKDIPLALRFGALLLQEIAQRATGSHREMLKAASTDLLSKADLDPRFNEPPLSDEIETLASRYPDLAFVTRLDRSCICGWIANARGIQLGMNFSRVPHLPGSANMGLCDAPGAITRDRWHGI